jgi:hypothetical protein
MAAMVPMVALVAAVWATFAAQDQTPIQMLPNGDSGSAQCGAYQLSWNNMPSFQVGVDGSVTLRATRASGPAVLDFAQPLATGERLIPRWCGDVLGDGSQALAYEMFSGGAHCCFSAHVVLLQPGARELLDLDLGNGGLGQPTQLMEGGPLQLIGGSDVFAYFDDLSFAASPFMPLIFSYDGQEYFEATRLFPDYLRAQAAMAEAELDDAVALGTPAEVPVPLRYQEQESGALRLYGLHVLLGDADRALPSIQARVAPPVSDWLGANAPAAAAAIAAAYN